MRGREGGMERGREEDVRKGEATLREELFT